MARLTHAMYSTFIVFVSLFIVSNVVGIPVSDLESPLELEENNVDFGESTLGFEESEALAYLDYYEEQASYYCNLASVAEFEYETNLGSVEAEENAKAASIAYAEFELREFHANISQFNFTDFSDEDLKRQFTFMSAIGTSALDSEDLNKYNDVLSEMSKIYGQAKVCPYTNKTCDLEKDGLALEPELTNILGEMKNFNEMAYYWKAWRDATGKHMRGLYNEYVDLSNRAAEANDYDNMGDFWLLRYESNTDEFRKELDDVWQKLRVELYEPLYNYVRDRLSKKFLQMDPNGPMPAHVFGNMWAQSWEHALPYVLPFPNASAFDITPELQASVIDYPDERAGIVSLFNFANTFFHSLGLEDMKVAYSEKAMIMKPADRDVICHASAWDMCDKSDFRIKMCTEVNHENFITIHHELGHIQYYLQYKDLPITYRTGANPGFHEAIGDVIALSVSTPKHLKTIGFLNKEVTDESMLNYLMQMALDKIAFLPFGYLIDSYRWGIFNGKTARTNLTYDWIQMRANIQGIVPPFKRKEDDFDAGAKYHVPANTPYIRYFVSYILQFQIQQRLCEEAGHDEELHTCDIYSNKEAGELLKQILKSGAQKNWKELLMEITGDDKLNADAIISYFKPLMDHLKQVQDTEKYPTTGWKDININGYYGDGEELVTPTEPTTTTTTPNPDLSTTENGQSPSTDLDLSTTENGQSSSTSGDDDDDDETSIAAIIVGAALAVAVVVIMVGYFFCKKCRK